MRSFDFEMVPQNAVHFFDDFRMRLSGVAGTDHFFGGNSFNVRALVGNHAVGLTGDRPGAEDGDDRVRGDSRIDGTVI